MKIRFWKKKGRDFEKYRKIIERLIVFLCLGCFIAATIQFWLGIFNFPEYLIIIFVVTIAACFTAIISLLCDIKIILKTKGED